MREPKSTCTGRPEEWTYSCSAPFVATAVKPASASALSSARRKAVVLMVARLASPNLLQGCPRGAGNGGAESRRMLRAPLGRVLNHLFEIVAARRPADVPDHESPEPRALLNLALQLGQISPVLSQRNHDIIVYPLRQGTIITVRIAF